MILPKALQKGDTIGVIAPASPPNILNMKKAIPFFENLGLKVQLGHYVEEVHGYLAGTDEQRLKDLHDMFRDDNIKAIICAGGGYGTGRLAAFIDYDLIKNHPKIFWGYSDITYLHTAIRQQTGLITFHGPMLASDIGKDDFHEHSKQAFNQLFQPTPVILNLTYSELKVISKGDANGEIVGGNLSLIVNSLGGPYEIDTNGKLLFIEDVDEPPYRVDSFLSQLKHAGKLDDAAGIIVGDFNNAKPKIDRPSFTLEHVLNDYLSTLNKPVISGFKIGHCQPHYAIPLGVQANLSSEFKSLSIEPGVIGGSS